MTNLQLIHRIPLFEGLDAAALDDVLRIFERVEIGAGACLTRQGQPADSAYILESGSVDVETALPGGGTTGVAVLESGAVIGEMALLDSGIYSATVRAREPAVCHRVGRDGFRLLLAQRVPAVFAVQQRITLAMCRRLRALNARVMAAEAGGPELPAARPEPASAPVAEAPFDLPAFLPVLAPFRDFSPAQVALLMAMTRTLRLPRGETLFRQDDPADTAWIVVRGALELTALRGDRLHRIGVLGPGRLCGVLALIEERPHSMQARVREQATLLALDRAAFRRLLGGHDALAMKMQQAVNRELLQALARTNNHLTRLVSRARVRGLPATELEQALGGQGVRPA